MKNNNPISQELLETIERYLKNTMDIEERNTFEKKLKNNATLQQQVKDIETLLFGVRKAVFKTKANHFHDELINKDSETVADTKVFRLNFKQLSIAASVIILLGSVWFFNQSNSNQDIFSKYYIEDRGLETNMGESDNYTFDDAMVDYKQKKYTTAIDKWSALLKSKPENDTLNYFLGVAHLANKNENKATNYLKTVVKTSKSEFLNEAYFYLGLSYLKMDNTDLAIEYFEKSNSERSKTIILELKK